MGEGGSNRGLRYSTVEYTGEVMGMYKYTIMEWDLVVKEKAKRAFKEEENKNKKETTRGRNWSMAD